MARLTEEMVIARSKQSDLASIKKLNCWGAELSDVSLIRRMDNVEVLAMSINKIRTLEDFSWCRRLRELFIRKNEIRDLREIRHLRHLPLLTCLWLDENPCTEHPDYRMTVLRNLPNLEKLDNVQVSQEEVAEAMRRGDHIPDSDDEGYSQQEPPSTGRVRSCDSSPDRGPNTHEGSEGSEPGVEYRPETPTHAQEAQYSTGPPSPTRPPPDVRSVNIRSRSAEGPGLPHSLSAHAVQEYSYSNGDYVTSPGYAESQYNGDRTQDRPLSCRCESYQQLPTREWERDREREAARGRERDREYASAVMAERRGFTRRPVARNSNLLSAVLCLVKELDYPSLEVAEMAVRCRMDELANSQ